MFGRYRLAWLSSLEVAMKKHVRLFVFILSLVCSFAVFAGPAYAATDTPIVVSMGDSFASGEGVDPYFGQESEDKYWNQDWLGHRSQSNWAGQLVIDGYQLSSIRAIPASTPIVDGDTITYPLDDWTGGTWFLVAASGARIDEMFDRSLYNSYDVDRPITGTSEYVTYTAQLVPQIEIFDYIDATYGKGAVDYVTVGMGGLELNFSDTLVQTGLTPAVPGSTVLSDSLNETKEYFQSTLKFDIAQGLISIRQAAGPQAKIIVCGYPELFSGGGFSLLFQSSEMEEADAFVVWFDQQMRQLVQELNASGFDNLYYVSVIDAFSGHGSYSSDAWIYGVVVGYLSEDLNYTNPKHIVSPSSFHPMKKGTEAIAAEIQKLIDQLEAPEQKTGWVIENGSYYFYEDDGSLRRNAWASYDGSWYYLGENGKVLTNSWVSYSGSWYYLGKDGKVVVNGWASYNGSWYYLGKDGKVVVNGWALYNGSYYYLKANGKPAVSELLTIGGTQYYFNDKGVCVWKSA